ncbi:hypothetical protein PIB30_085104 [Stylosanthes scabra]|uniref:Uncharacterized protein n=2 Tax=Stylosanthes scabra TaxID=79078 RepID=A0ABU6WW27_9FABA|nr:hypothetical protein [Stylosanthes scabra]
MARYEHFRRFGPPEPNIRNSCSELMKVGVSDVPGFVRGRGKDGFYFSFSSFVHPSEDISLPYNSIVVLPSCPEAFALLLLIISQVFLEMAENQPENQKAVVPAVGAARIPRELPPIYRWVSRDVLGASPILSQAYLDKLKLSGVIFGQRLLNRASVAPSQLHPNAWSAIRCFELVTDFLRLPQDPKVFLYLFTLFSPNTEGKTKKGYMSVRPGKYRKIFLFLEGQGRFPPYWSRDAGMDYVPVTYKGLNADQKDTADILVKLFSEWNLKPKTVLSNPSEAREAIVDMAGKEVTLERLRRLIRPGSSQSVPAISVPAPGPSRTPVEPQPVPTDDNVVFPEGGFEQRRWCEKAARLGKRPADDVTVEPKRPRVSEGTNREFCSMDRSFGASGFIASNLLGPHAQDVLKDYDPMESIRWAEWASLRSATIMKSIEPRLMAADQWEGRCVKLNGDLKALNLQRIEAEKEKLAAEQARVKAEGDLKSLSGKLEVLEKEKAEEAERRKNRESELKGEI